MPQHAIVSAMTIKRIHEALASGRLTINALDDGSGVVLDVDGEQMLTMNATGLAIIQAIADGAADLEAVADYLVERFSVERELALEQAGRFITEVDDTVGPVADMQAS